MRHPWSWPPPSRPSPVHSQGHRDPPPKGGTNGSTPIRSTVPDRLNQRGSPFKGDMGRNPTGSTPWGSQGPTIRRGREDADGHLGEWRYVR